ncbi:hypothetical protein LLW09_07610 [Pseudomonas paracarnis]|uniref:Uncharacterized protein n=1 Tax=Pseudomonas paracarnis TaxID=2750625 RepID=A0ABU6BQ26_9PSED|nr:hypothetical protein [Pseudomonas paracarnis]MEB3782420.1 hypothetical protein [Pseudomonas paracarnis]
MKTAVSVPENFLKRIALVLGACSVASSALAVQLQWYRVEATKQQIAYAKDKASYDLLDPQSAQFRNIYAVSSGNGHDYVCGQINAKNSYGAYTGFKAFYVDSIGNVQLDTPDNQLGDIVPSICNKPRKGQ